LIQGFFLEEALGERIGLTDEEWALIGPLLPAERGRGCLSVVRTFGATRGVN